MAVWRGWSSLDELSSQLRVHTFPLAIVMSAYMYPERQKLVKNEEAELRSVNCNKTESPRKKIWILVRAESRFLAPTPADNSTFRFTLEYMSKGAQVAKDVCSLNA